MASQSPRTSYNALSTGDQQDGVPPLGLQSLQEDDRSIQMINTHGWNLCSWISGLGRNQRPVIDMLLSLLGNTLSPLKPFVSCIGRGKTHSPSTSTEGQALDQALS